jgi:hypothetical protein
VRLGGRDVAGLMPVGDMYGAPYDLLGGFLDVQSAMTPTQIQLDALTHATAHDADAWLLDLIPLLSDTIDLHPDHIQTALYQAFDIQALYKDDMNQVTLFATITTSTPKPSPPSSLTSATTPPWPTAAAPSPATTAPVYPFGKPPIPHQIRHDHEGPPGQWPRKASSSHHEPWSDVTLASISSGASRDPSSHAWTARRSRRRCTVMPWQPNPRAIRAIFTGGKRTVSSGSPSGAKWCTSAP